MNARPPSKHPELYLPFCALSNFGVVVEIEFYPDKDVGRKASNDTAHRLAKQAFQSIFSPIDNEGDPKFVLRKVAKSGRPSLQRSQVFEITAKLQRGNEVAKWETLFSKLQLKVWPTEQDLQVLAEDLFVRVQRRLLGNWRDIDSNADLARWLHISRAVCAEEGGLCASMYQADCADDLLKVAADKLWDGLDGAEFGFELIKGTLSVVTKTVDISVSDANGNLALLQYKLLQDGRVEGSAGGALQGHCDSKGKKFTGEPAALLQLLRHSGGHCGLHLSWSSSGKVLNCPPDRVRKLIASIATAHVDGAYGDRTADVHAATLSTFDEQMRLVCAELGAGTQSWSTAVIRVFESELAVVMRLLRRDYGVSPHQVQVNDQRCSQQLARTSNDFLLPDVRFRHERSYIDVTIAELPPADRVAFCIPVESAVPWEISHASQTENGIFIAHSGGGALSDKAFHYFVWHKELMVQVLQHERNGMGDSTEVNGMGDSTEVNGMGDSTEVKGSVHTSRQRWSVVDDEGVVSQQPMSEVQDWSCSLRELLAAHQGAHTTTATSGAATSPGGPPLLTGSQRSPTKGGPVPIKVAKTLSRSISATNEVLLDGTSRILDPGCMRQEVAVLSDYCIHDAKVRGAFKKTHALTVQCILNADGDGHLPNAGSEAAIADGFSTGPPLKRPAKRASKGGYCPQPRVLLQPLTTDDLSTLQRVDELTGMMGFGSTPQSLLTAEELRCRAASERAQQKVTASVLHSHSMPNSSLHISLHSPLRHKHKKPNKSAQFALTSSMGRKRAGPVGSGNTASTTRSRNRSPRKTPASQQSLASRRPWRRRHAQSKMRFMRSVRPGYVLEELFGGTCWHRSFVSAQVVQAVDVAAEFNLLPRIQLLIAQADEEEEEGGEEGGLPSPKLRPPRSPTLRVHGHLKSARSQFNQCMARSEVIRRFFQDLLDLPRSHFPTHNDVVSNLREFAAEIGRGSHVLRRFAACAMSPSLNESSTDGLLSRVRVDAQMFVWLASDDAAADGRTGDGVKSRPYLTDLVALETSILYESGLLQTMVQLEQACHFLRAAFSCTDLTYISYLENAKLPQGKVDGGHGGAMADLAILRAWEVVYKLRTILAAATAALPGHETKGHPLLLAAGVLSNCIAVLLRKDTPDSPTSDEPKGAGGILNRVWSLATVLACVRLIRSAELESVGMAPLRSLLQPNKKSLHAQQEEEGEWEQDHDQQVYEDDEEDDDEDDQEGYTPAGTPAGTPRTRWLDEEELPQLAVTSTAAAAPIAISTELLYWPMGKQKVSVELSKYITEVCGNVSSMCDMWSDEELDVMVHAPALSLLGEHELGRMHSYHKEAWDAPLSPSSPSPLPPLALTPPSERQIISDPLALLGLAQGKDESVEATGPQDEGSEEEGVYVEQAIRDERYHMLLLGDNGEGKSAVLKKLVCLCARHRQSSSHTDPMPLYIDVRHWCDVIGKNRSKRNKQRQHRQKQQQQLQQQQQQQQQDESLAKGTHVARTTSVLIHAALPRVAVSSPHNLLLPQEGNDLLAEYIEHEFGHMPKRLRLICEARRSGALVCFIDGLENTTADLAPVLHRYISSTLPSSPDAFVQVVVSCTPAACPAQFFEAGPAGAFRALRVCPPLAHVLAHMIDDRVRTRGTPLTIPSALSACPSSPPSLRLLRQLSDSLRNGSQRLHDDLSSSMLLYSTAVEACSQAVVGATVGTMWVMDMVVALLTRGKQAADPQVKEPSPTVVGGNLAKVVQIQVEAQLLEQRGAAIGRGAANGEQAKGVESNKRRQTMQQRKTLRKTLSDRRKTKARRDPSVPQSAAAALDEKRQTTMMLKLQVDQLKDFVGTYAETMEDGAGQELIAAAQKQYSDALADLAATTLPSAAKSADSSEDSVGKSIAWVCSEEGRATLEALSFTLAFGPGVSGGQHGASAAVISCEMAEQVAAALPEGIPRSSSSFAEQWESLLVLADCTNSLLLSQAKVQSASKADSAANREDEDYDDEGFEDGEETTGLADVGVEAKPAPAVALTHVLIQEHLAARHIIRTLTQEGFDLAAKVDEATVADALPGLLLSLLTDADDYYDDESAEMRISIGAERVMLRVADYIADIQQERCGGENEGIYTHFVQCFVGWHCEGRRGIDALLELLIERHSSLLNKEILELGALLRVKKLAVCKIQNAWRLYLAWQEAQFLRENKARTLEKKRIADAAIKLQMLIRRIVRAIRSSKRHVIMVKKARRDRKIAASRIQALIRGVEVRNRVVIWWAELRVEMAEAERQQQAGRKITRCARGFLAGRKHELWLMGEDASTCIQALGRGAIQRRKYEVVLEEVARAEEATIVLQSLVRMSLAKAQVQQLRQSKGAIRIQVMLRHWLALRKMTRTREVVRALREVRRADSATSIQRIHRGGSARISCMGKRRALACVHELKTTLSVSTSGEDQAVPVVLTVHSRQADLQLLCDVNNSVLKANGGQKVTMVLLTRPLHWQALGYSRIEALKPAQVQQLYAALISRLRLGLVAGRLSLTLDVSHDRPAVVIQRQARRRRHQLKFQSKKKGAVHIQRRLARGPHGREVVIKVKLLREQNAVECLFVGAWPAHKKGLHRPRSPSSLSKVREEQATGERAASNKLPPMSPWEWQSVEGGKWKGHLRICFKKSHSVEESADAAGELSVSLYHARSSTTLETCVGFEAWGGLLTGAGIDKVGTAGASNGTAVLERLVHGNKTAEARTALVVGISHRLRVVQAEGQQPAMKVDFSWDGAALRLQTQMRRASSRSSVARQVNAIKKINQFLRRQSQRQAALQLQREEEERARLEQERIHREEEEERRRLVLAALSATKLQTLARRVLARQLVAMKRALVAQQEGVLAALQGTVQGRSGFYWLGGTQTALEKVPREGGGANEQLVYYEVDEVFDDDWLPVTMPILASAYWLSASKARDIARASAAEALWRETTGLDFRENLAECGTSVFIPTPAFCDRLGVPKSQLRFRLGSTGSDSKVLNMSVWRQVAGGVGGGEDEAFALVWLAPQLRVATSTNGPLSRCWIGSTATTWGGGLIVSGRHLYVQLALDLCTGNVAISARDLRTMQLLQFRDRGGVENKAGEEEASYPMKSIPGLAEAYPMNEEGKYDQVLTALYDSELQMSGLVLSLGAQ
jgi:hypothetical protein